MYFVMYNSIVQARVPKIHYAIIKTKFCNCWMMKVIFFFREDYVIGRL